MAISSPGIGSGLDVNSIVSQLVALERRPINSLQATASTIQTQISAYGKVQSLVTGLRDAAAALAKPTLWQQTTASSSDAGTLGASATGSAAAGSYNVVVGTVARAHSLASQPVLAEPATVGAGRLTIQIGAWDGGVFSAGGAEALVLDFDDPATTLEQVRDRINGATGSAVTASIVRDASGARLTLTSKATGLEHAMRVTATDLGGTPLVGGLGTLAYAPDAGANGLSQTQAPANALVTVNGLDVESSSNQLDGVIDGLTLSLIKPSDGPVTITVNNDAGAQRKAVQDFVTAYNALNGFLAEQTKYNETTKAGAPLQGDSAALGLRNQLRSLLRESNGAATVFSQLSSVGFDVQRDGTIKLDTAKLDAALAQPAELGKLFASTDTVNAGNRGLALRFQALGDQLTRSDGLLTSRNEGLQARLKRNRTEQEKLEDRVERTRERLLRQYQALDARIGQLNNLSTYISQQMTMLNNQFTSDK